jgi:hypothetical protein
MSWCPARPSTVIDVRASTRRVYGPAYGKEEDGLIDLPAALAGAARENHPAMTGAVQELARPAIGAAPNLTE